MVQNVYPEKFLTLNESNTKFINLVMVIEGVDYVFSLLPVYKRIRFGDPDVYYGDTGLVYGGLIPLPNCKPWIKNDQNITLGQKLEPEQGRASVSSISVSLIDKGGYFTQLCAPGILIDEILGNKEVKLYLGYQDSGFPEDYFVVFRGVVSGTALKPGSVILSLSDPNQRRKAKIFDTGKTRLTDGLLNGSIVQYAYSGTGNGVISNLSPKEGIISDTISVTCVSVDNNSCKFDVSGAVAGFIGSVNNNSKFDCDYFSFNLYSGTTQFEVGDAFSLSSTYNPESTLSVINSSRLYEYIVGPAGGYDYKSEPTYTTDDGTVTCYAKVDSEWMQYAPGQPSGNSIAVTRGGDHGRSTSVVEHDAGADVDCGIQLFGNAIDLALKLMLSGWDGPWKDDLTCVSLGSAQDSDLVGVKNVILLGASTDAKDDLGLTIGDYVTISGSSSGNNGTYQITAIDEGLGRQNRLLYIDSDLTEELDTSNVTLSLRSKYDTLPVLAGLKMKPTEVDVETFEKVRDRYFSTAENRLRLFFQQSESGKEVIESKILLPIGAYSLTRYGRLSIGYTRPPVAEDKLVYINEDNVLEPENI